MKKYHWFVLAVGLVFIAAATARAESGLTLEIGTAVTLGEFTAEDTTIDVDTEYMNPMVGIELKLGDSPVSIGASYAQSENEFTGEWEDGAERGDGTINAERTDINVYARIGSRDGVNLRVGYRYFKYEFSDGLITIRENGRITEIDENAEANGDLTKGLDAELNLVAGTDVQFALAVGATYFVDAEYDWSYDKVEGGRRSREQGSATVDGYSARIRPEVSFLIGDQLRLFVNYTLQATTWDAEPPSGEDYPGVDIYSAAMVGLRLML